MKESRLGLWLTRSPTALEVWRDDAASQKKSVRLDVLALVPPERSLYHHRGLPFSTSCWSTLSIHHETQSITRLYWTHRGPLPVFEMIATLKIRRRRYITACVAWFDSVDCWCFEAFQSYPLLKSHLFGL